MYLCVYVQKAGDEMSGAGMNAVLVFFSFCALSGWMRQENIYLPGLGAMEPSDFPKKGGDCKRPRK